MISPPKFGGWVFRVGKGLADFLAPSNFGIPEAPVYRHEFVTPWEDSACQVTQLWDACREDPAWPQDRDGPEHSLP